MSGFEVTPEELSAAAAAAEESSDALSAELSRLCAVVTDVVGVSWRGAAAAGFAAAWDEWASGAREVLAALAAAAGVLRATGATYAAAEYRAVIAP